MALIKNSQNFLLDDEVIGITELDDIYRSMIHETRGNYYTNLLIIRCQVYKSS